MTRRLAIFPLAALLAVVATRPAPALDKVTRKSDPARPLTGKIISESAKGIEIKVGTSTEEIPAADILAVEHEITAGFKLEFYNPAFRSQDRIATARDHKKALAEALENFEKLLPKVAGGSYAHVRRNVEFRIASLTVQKAQEEGTSSAAGIAKLEEFLRHNPDSWQTVAAGQMLGRLLTAAGKYRQAEQVYQDLAANTALPEAARVGFRLGAARVSIRPGKYGNAYAKLQAILEKLSKDSRPALQARIYQAECLAGMGKFADAREQLTAVLGAARGDKELQAQAHNALGSCYAAAKQYKDALWEYLRVDVVYYQDREEHAKALYHLVDLFKKLKDAEHEKDCRDRLKGKEFLGTEYQARLLKEDKE